MAPILFLPSPPLLQETPKAFHVRLSDGSERWIPKSVARITTAMLQPNPFDRTLVKTEVLEVKRWWWVKNHQQQTKENPS